MCRASRIYTRMGRLATFRAEKDRAVCSRYSSSAMRDTLARLAYMCAIVQRVGGSGMLILCHCALHLEAPILVVCRGPDSGVYAASVCACGLVGELFLRCGACSARC